MDFCKLGLSVIEIEAESIQALGRRLGDDFNRACELILNCKGRVIVSGMGKSGHIASKIAATLASTGTPAFYVHPGEASHGDMGMITQDDVVIILSNSGNTSELVTIVPLLKRLQIPLIGILGNTTRELAQNCDAVLDASVTQEACPLGLAPTSSTTAALVMGDALAVALLKARGFTEEDFARSHPGGRLGRRLLIHVRDVMHAGENIPRVTPKTPATDAIIEMTSKKLGVTTVINDSNTLLGIITDGDLRRTLEKNIDLHQAKAEDIMTQTTKTIHADQLAAEALQYMNEHKITSLVILDNEQKVSGVLHLHDLLNAGVL